MEKHALLYLRNYGPGHHFGYFLNAAKRQKGVISLSPNFPIYSQKFPLPHVKETEREDNKKDRHTAILIMVFFHLF